MSATAGDLDRRLIEAGALLVAGGLTRGRSGNLSARCGSLGARTGAAMRITAAGARLGALGPGDLVMVALHERDGEERGPPAEAGGRGRRPSAETALHAAVYRGRPDVGAIVHTHSPYATAWTLNGSDLELILEDAVYYDMGTRVGLVPHAPGGSARLAELVAAELHEGCAALLERHGAITVAANIEEAVDLAHALEHQAHVAWAELAALRAAEPALARESDSALPGV
jgi:ribulose-5-phosphate 4-epimerase/fuculose-1-phosphate aldolase